MCCAGLQQTGSCKLALFMGHAVCDTGCPCLETQTTKVHDTAGQATQAMPHTASVLSSGMAKLRQVNQSAPFHFRKFCWAPGHRGTPIVSTRGVSLGEVLDGVLTITASHNSWTAALRATGVGSLIRCSYHTARGALRCLLELLRTALGRTRRLWSGCWPIQAPNKRMRENCTPRTP